MTETRRNAGAQDDGRLPRQIVDYGRGAAGFRAMRDETAALSETTFEGPISGFAARVSTFHLNSALLTEARMPRVRNDRTPLHVARSGIDHYMVYVYRRGQCHQWIGSDELVIGPGDVGVLDLAYPSRTMMVPRGADHFASPISMILPRPVLASLLPRQSEFGQQLFHRDSFYGRALRELLMNLSHHAEHIRLAESESAVRAVAALLAGGIPPTHRDPLDAKPTLGAAMRTVIESFLERMDTSPDDLGVSALCRRFGVSRASLYRMFEPHGGLVRYVRERQLRRALAVLASPAHRHRRVVDIALQHGFASESGFVRAFRRRFGITPGEARTDPTPSLGSGEAPAGALRAKGWLMALAPGPV